MNVVYGIGAVMAAGIIAFFSFGVNKQHQSVSIPSIAIHKDSIPTESTIDSMSVDIVTDLNDSNRTFYLWKICELSLAHFKLPAENIRSIKENKLFSLEKLCTTSVDLGLKVLKLEGCQAYAAAVLIANGIPVIIRQILNARPDGDSYFLLHRYLLHPEEKRDVSHPDYKGDEKVYFIHNFYDYTNHFVAYGRDIIDKNYTILRTTDLMDATQKKQYQEIMIQRRKSIANVAQTEARLQYDYSTSDFRYDPNTSISGVYILVPNVYKIKDIEKTISLGLSNKPVTYTVPRIVNLSDAISLKD
ncbi:MAG: hypothetical protein JNL74_19280 [Fibrobacteres bacterium]|nr:hypothetical protein [Fibrobacterota bacterium]